MKKIVGAITALATPFDKKGKVDVVALRKFVKFQLDGGIHGLVPCGSTGEAATMDLAEHELVVRTVVQEVKKRIPVIAGAGSNDTAKAIQLSKICKKAGVDALLHVTPYYNKPTPAGLVAHFKAIADAVDMPIILYNVPGRTGSNVSPQTILEISKKVPQVVAVKEASGSIPQMMEIVKGSSKDFSVLSGDDSIAVPLISVGGVGCISVVSNETPLEFSNLIQSALEGNFEEAKKLHYILLDLMNVNFIESNPIPVKTALAMMGLIKESFRLPMVKMMPKNKEILEGILKKGGWIK